MEVQTRQENWLLHHVKQDPVLFAALDLAVFSAFLIPPSLAYIGYLDIRVLSLLLSLMLVVAGLKQASVFQYLVERLLGLVHNARTLAIALMSICFFSSMLITNDVALITFVPLAIMLLTEAGKKELLIPMIVIQTIAANLGSMLTPLGNPQNLYLYSISGMSTGKFLAVMAIPTILSFALLMAACLLIKPEPVATQNREPVHLVPKAVIPWIALFILCLLTVAHVIHFGIVLAVVLLSILALNRDLLPKADYGLLLTFVFFFIFIGNMKNIPAVSEFLSGLVAGRELTIGILLSQIISNVPAAMLLSGFTTQFEPLLLGVNLGGLGTLIASMASLISYKLYAATEGADMGRYMVVFTGLNVLFLAVLWLMTIFVV